MGLPRDFDSDVNDFVKATVEVGGLEQEEQEEHREQEDQEDQLDHGFTERF